VSTASRVLQRPTTSRSSWLLFPLVEPSQRVYLWASIRRLRNGGKKPPKGEQKFDPLRTTEVGSSEAFHPNPDSVFESANPISRQGSVLKCRLSGDEEIQRYRDTNHSTAKPQNQKRLEVESIA